MVSDFVMTELELRALKPTPDPVGMGSYNMDSHNVQRYVDENGHARNEGDIQINPGGPYPISYRAIVPRREECANLLVPVCVSSSHIAYGSIRMEPVFMILGQSAATAAVHALQQKCDVQSIDYRRLRDRLLDDGQVLAWDGPRRKTSLGVLPKTLKGVVVDDVQASVVGAWPTSRAIGPFVAAGYRHDENADQGGKQAKFSARLLPGVYEVRFAYSPGTNRADNVTVVVHHADGQSELQVNEKEKPPIDDLFVSLGTFTFGPEPAMVEVSNRGANGHVVIDAVQFLPAGKD